MIKAVIFDFDGVLGNTYDINHDLSKSFDSEMTEQDFIDHHKGNVFDEPKIKFKKEDIPVFFEKQKKMFTKDHLFPLRKVLEEIENKFQLFIISSTTDENIKHFLELGGNDKFFLKILGATTHRSKIEKFKMIFDQYNLLPEECLFITDTTGDIIEARNFDIKTIAVTWGFHKKELLLEQKPFAIIDTPDELLECINKCSQ